MSEHHLDILRRISRAMRRWDEWWWWRIMKNHPQANEVRCAISSWADDLDDVIKELEG